MFKRINGSEVTSNGVFTDVPASIDKKALKNERREVAARTTALENLTLPPENKKSVVKSTLSSLRVK